MTALQTLTVADDGFGFDTSTGETYTLNSCGHLVLQQLQQGKNRTQIALLLSEQFGIAQSSTERDVSDFMQQLEMLGFIQSNLAGVKR
ncbi:PqqD family protein [Tumidithrix elongata RA019]|uniref:PqqD family protein n=1 Tax=Tumidithrix elongata BACA0141 TaxID=2716417 RepID=A0AAW9PXG1_9CYAN|nr:PqqD family protein [Tumidithrix elongata RA019]